MMWCRGGLVVSTAHIHSAKPEFRFSAGLNPTHGISKISMSETPAWK